MVPSASMVATPIETGAAGRPSIEAPSALAPVEAEGEAEGGDGEAGAAEAVAAVAPPEAASTPRCGP